MPASSGPLKLHRSYNFVDKHWVIDEVRTIIADEGVSLKYVEQHSGVCVNTMRNWFNGKTIRPQVPTVNAVLRIFGKKLGVVDVKETKARLKIVKS